MAAPFISSEAQALAICGAHRAQQQLHRITGALRLLSGQTADTRWPPEEGDYNSFCEVVHWLANTADKEADVIDSFLERYDAEQAARDAATGCAA